MGIGRPKRHFETKNKETIVGLCALGNGRWRITLEGPHKGKRFNERDERLAVERFRQIVGEAPTVEIPVAQLSVEQLVSDEPNGQRDTFAASLVSSVDAAGNVSFSHKVNEDRIWAWCREQIIANKINAAKKLGLPGIATLDVTEKFITPLKLQTLIDTYDNFGVANWRTKGQARSAFKRLRQVTGAETLADLDTAKLIAFRDTVNGELAPSGAAQVFGKVKAVVAFAAKYGLDANQISPALTRMKVLYAPPAGNRAKPQPISPDDYRELLKHADTEWRAILLLALNMALYIEDICTLKYEDFDLAARTYVGKRAKTQVVRIGWLWQESIDAVNSLPRKGSSPLLFTSQTGLRFNASSKYDTYASLRARAGVAAPFSSIRDGGYSEVAATCDEKTAKLFAAHRFGGLMDSYVQRRPELVKTAAEAVHRKYSPFPQSLG
jgi:integrase